MVLRCQNQVYRRPYPFNYTSSDFLKKLNVFSVERKNKVMRDKIQFLMSAFITLMFMSFTLEASAKSYVPSAFTFEIHEQVQGLRGTKEYPLTLKYKYPQKLKIESQGERPLVYVCRPDKSEKYTPPFIEGEKGELVVSKKKQECFSIFFDLLRAGLKSNEYFKVTKTKDTAHTFLLEMTSKGEAKTSLNSVLIEYKEKSNFEFKDIQSLKLIQNKKVMFYLVKQIDTKSSLSEKDFQINIPVNTNVTYLD